MRMVDDIEQQIQQSEAGTLFFVSDFAKAGNDVFISRLVSEFSKKGLLCRLAKGVYYKLIQTRFGILYPEIGALVKAIAAETMPRYCRWWRLLRICWGSPLRSRWIMYIWHRVRLAKSKSGLALLRSNVVSRRISRQERVPGHPDPGDEINRRKQDDRSSSYGYQWPNAMSEYLNEKEDCPRSTTFYLTRTW